MDAAEFVEVGSKILKIGTQLSDLRAEREALDKQISLLESEFVPLVVRHGELLAEMAGTAMPKPPPPPAPVPTFSVTPAPANDKMLLVNRIKGFLKQAEESEQDQRPSATQIAEALKVDPTLVREIMRDVLSGAGS